MEPRAGGQVVGHTQTTGKAWWERRGPHPTQQWLRRPGLLAWGSWEEGLVPTAPQSCLGLQAHALLQTKMPMTLCGDNGP